jgi:hypothetical protein
MVSNEVWLDSQATVSMIPEQDIYLGAFPSSAASTVSGDKRTITLGSGFTAHFSLVADLYRGCVVDFYTTADVLVDRARIISNTATTITVLDSLSFATDGAAVADLSTHYGIIHHYGAPVPAPKGGSASSNTAQVLTIDFKSSTASDYNDHGIIFGTLPSVGGTEEDVLIRFASDGIYGGGITGHDTTVTADFDETQLTTISEFIDAIIAAINLVDVDFTAVREDNSLVITNDFGGAITRTAALDDGTGTLGSPTAPATTLIELTVTTAGATESSNNPRLLSDNWLGLASAITVPSTSVEPKQINVGLGGTRNFTYQFKGAETTSEFNMTAFANSFPWLYYTLGSMSSIAGSDETGSVTPTDDGFTVGSVTGFVRRDNQLHRVISGEVCPPLNGTGNVTQLDDAIDHITYTIAEKESSDLPSFAIEYTLKKPGFESTVATDADKEDVYTKIYPGCTVNNLQLTAAAGQELECTVSAMPKNTFIAPTNYDTFNNKTDVASFVNFGTRAGEDTSAPVTMEEHMRPFFFSDGTIELFGQEFLKIENMTLTIDNGLQQKRFIGNYDKRSQENFAGQRTYNLTFSALVTDATIFDHFRREHAFSLQGVNDADIKLEFTKDLTGSENQETLSLHFQDYHVTQADFPLTNDNGPMVVNWTIVPLSLKKCELKTYWAIQG